MTLSSENEQLANLSSLFLGCVLIPSAIIVFLAATFVSDYLLLGFIPAFYICWLSVVLLRVILKIPFSRAEFQAQLLLTALLYPLFVFHVWQADVYYNSVIFCILYVTAIPLLQWILQYRASVAFWVCVLTAFFLGFSIYLLSQGVIRSYVIFGPNVLYRIYVFLFGLMILCLFDFKAPGRRVILSGTLVVIFLYIMTAILGVLIVATGSRGGLVAAVGALLVIAYLARTLADRYSSMVFGVFTLLGGGALLVAVLLGPLLGRLLFLDLSNTSEMVRLELLRQTFRFLTEAGPAEILFGVGAMNRFFSFYPHNIFAEALVYGGLFLLLVVIMAFVVLTIAIGRRKNDGILVLPFVGIIVGSLFSGSLLYNYPVLSLAAYLVCSWLGGTQRSGAESVVRRHPDSSIVSSWSGSRSTRIGGQTAAS